MRLCVCVFSVYVFCFVDYIGHHSNPSHLTPKKAQKHTVKEICEGMHKGGGAV